MTWISKADLHKSIDAGELEALTQGDDSIVEHGISVAIAQVKSYLATRYDVSVIFGTSGTERDPLVMRFCIDISIYEIAAIRQPGVDMEDRRARRDDAIDWLKQVQAEKISPDLPVLTDEDGNTKTLIQGGSVQPPRVTHY